LLPFYPIEQRLTLLLEEIQGLEATQHLS
jgi:hypothetical protein